MSARAGAVTARAGATGLAGVALCVLAGAFAIPSLFVPGLALAGLALTASVWVGLATRGVHLTRWVSASTIQEGEELSVAIALERSRIPLPGGAIEPWPGAEPLPSTAGASALTILPAVLTRRGRHRLGPARLRVEDPLGLARRVIESPPIDVLVLPRVEEVRRAQPGTPDGAGETRGPSTSRPQGALEVDSLRPHTPGAPASRIHWPTVARTGVLMQRRLVEDADQRPLVVVDPHSPSSEDALDQALRAAASLCVHLAERSCALLLPGERRASRIEPDLRGWPALHVRLALVSSHDGALWREPIERAATVLWVSAAAAPPRALMRTGARECYLVSPHPLPGRAVAFTVAGCSGQRVRARAAVR